MDLYIIVFQIDDSERIQKIVNAIKDYILWACITNNVWRIKVENRTTSEIRLTINEKCSLQNNERLLIFNITDCAWVSYNLPKEVTDWIKN